MATSPAPTSPLPGSFTTPEGYATWAQLMHLAYQHASASKDPSTQTGAVLVREHPGGRGGVPVPGTGAFNDLPAEVRDTPEQWERPRAYSLVEHAERNAVYAAARAGIRTQDLAMVATWWPCADCARAIIQSGVTLLVTHRLMNDKTPDSWADSIALAGQMLTDAGVRHLTVDEPVDGPAVRFRGALWTP